MLALFCLALFAIKVSSVSSEIQLPIEHDNEQFHFIMGGDFCRAVLDVLKGLPTFEVNIIFDTEIDVGLLENLTWYLLKHKMSLRLFNISTSILQENYYNFMTSTAMSYLDSTNIFICSHLMEERVLLELIENNLIRRNILYIFYWGRGSISRTFQRSLNEVMKVLIITNPRNDTYRLYYNQATSHRKHHIDLVNWWTDKSGLFYYPTLPNAYTVFKNFNGRIFQVPVVHKPPWHFVRYYNDSIEVLGGRDDKLVSLLADKLNFRYEYFDPPDRGQGSTISTNGTFSGVLSLIWTREADFFLGDVALTLDRINVVEFSFLTLADSGAFVTHNPSKLNEALALLRPFQWQVWPPIVLTMLILGPILYALIALPNSWQPRMLIQSHRTLLIECIWFTITVFFRQCQREPSDSHKVRLFTIIISLSMTYVISDMYSANLTSLLARPGRERPISNLQQLEAMMRLHDYQLYVERHSSTLSLLENGTGIYGSIWELMQRQKEYEINSVENGVQLVKNSKNIALLAGRETLYFDIQRFGSNSFHLSEKLNTAYSAIALQIGCPYIDNFNKILMAIFEAGILTKMTQDEYEKLGKQQMEQSTTNSLEFSNADRHHAVPKSSDDDKLQPISIKMLQGAFYILFIGYSLSGLILGLEHLVKSQKRNCNFVIKRKKLKIVHRCFNKICIGINVLLHHTRRRIHDIWTDAVLETLDYME